MVLAFQRALTISFHTSAFEGDSHDDDWLRSDSLPCPLGLDFSEHPTEYLGQLTQSSYYLVLSPAVSPLSIDFVHRSH